ncbi:MAG: RHS repeat-associated core domain-containing protein, partial [Sphingobacteriales bacterium]
VEPAAPTGGGTAGSPVKVYLHGFKTKASGTSTTYAVAPDVLSTYLDSSKWTLSTPGQAGIFSTYLSGAGMDSALGFAVTPTTGSAMTLTFKVKAGYRLNILSFSFYNRTTATNWGTGVTTGYKNWLMTINGLQVGADTMNRGFTMVSTGTRIVENPANGLMGTVLNFSNSFDKTGTLRIDSFTLNGYVEQIPDTGHDPVTTTDGKGYRYGFNGQEHEDETAPDDYDFGSRIYDSRIGKWMSIDPLQRKYPEVTPYAYCLGNPVVFIDPDGKVVIISDKNGKKLATIKADGKVFYEKGQEQAWQVHAYLEARTYLGEHSSLRYLETHKRMVTIMVTDEAVNGLAHYQNNSVTRTTFTDANRNSQLDPNEVASIKSEWIDETSGGIIRWNPKHALKDKQGNRHSPALVLEHEGSHGEHALENLSEYARYTFTKLDGARDNLEEVHAVTATNEISRQLNNGDGGNGGRLD